MNYNPPHTHTHTHPFVQNPSFGQRFFWRHPFPISACGAKYQMYSWGFEELLCVFAFVWSLYLRKSLCKFGNPARVNMSLCNTGSEAPVMFSTWGKALLSFSISLFQRAIWNRFQEQIGTEIMQWREWIIWRKALCWIGLPWGKFVT